MPQNSSKNANSSGESNSGKKKLSQTDVPSYPLEQALRIPKAIAENYAYHPTKPLQVAKAMDMQPKSGGFRGLCGAAIAYGLTEGGPNASEISIKPLGMRIVRPLEENDDIEARREALLQPRVISEFLNKYDGASIPRQDIAKNVLADMNVPQEKVESVLSLILEEARTAGFIEEIKNKEYIDLSKVPSTATVDIETDEVGDNPENTVDQNTEDPPSGNAELGSSENEVSEPSSPKKDPVHKANERRVFVTHGKNKTFIEPIKKLLSFGELEAIVAVERPSVSQPLPDKVMKDMRNCGAAIIHVDAEHKLIDQEAKEYSVLNPNVLIEIGAAIALYGRRFILLVKEGVELPSNLHGLFEVRYKGDSLDGEATIRLLEAINDIKNHPIPARYSEGN